jgi:holo-[acyl-carrier protein] synthase
VNRWGSAMVGFTGLSRPQELIGDMRLDVVYTPAERIRSGTGRTLQHWAGRLAGKHAVLRLLGVAPTEEHLGQAEVLPRPTANCAKTEACHVGHPPGVRLGPLLSRVAGTEQQIRLSLSHTSGRVLAVAVVSGRLPEDERPAEADEPRPPEDEPGWLSKRDIRRPREAGTGLVASADRSLG